VIKKLTSIEFSKFAPLLVTLAFVLILIQYSFHPLDSIFLDSWMRNDFSSKTIQSPIVVVVMDDESDQFLGETYPYSYASHHRLMTRLIQDDPALINYFVSLLEPDSEVEQRYQIEFHDSLSKFSPSGQKFRFGTEIDNLGEQIPPESSRDLGYNLGQIYKDQMIFSKD
jgi:CHASE2 domain-containing sensor protein